MKKTLLSTIIAGTIFCFTACTSTKKTTTHNSPAEKADVKNNISLANGQKITVTTMGNSDADMGMGMQTKNTTSATNIISVIASDDSSYTVSNTLSKIKMSMDMMSQQTNYDSENPADKDSEIGKGVAGKINQADTFSVNKNSGNIVKHLKNTSPERAEENPLMEMMAAMGVNTSKDPTLESAFFIIPAGKKTGDSWTDSISEKTIKTIKTYTLQSIDKNIATILVNSTITGSGESEMQGTSVSFTISTKGKGEMTVDVDKGLVNKITNEADVTMAMEIMGQTMPISSKTNSTITYQY